MIRSYLLITIYSSNSKSCQDHAYPFINSSAFLITLASIVAGFFPACNSFDVELAHTVNMTDGSLSSRALASNLMVIGGVLAACFLNGFSSMHDTMVLFTLVQMTCLS